MHGDAIWEEDDPEPAVLRLRDSAPASDSAVSLNPFMFRVADYLPEPAFLNRRSVRPLADCVEVARGPHPLERTRHGMVRLTCGAASAARYYRLR